MKEWPDSLIAGNWTDEYAAIIEHYFWSPQQINRRSAEARLPWDVVWRRLMGREVPLNHLLNIFFRLAPDELTASILNRGLPDPGVNAVQPINLRAYASHGHMLSGICQPDFAFASEYRLIFMEMKVGHRLSDDQILKYALTAAVLERVDATFLCLGPKKLMGAVSAFVASRNTSLTVSPKLQRWAEKFHVKAETLLAVARNLEFGWITYQDLHDVLRADAAGGQEPTRRRLVSGMADALADWGHASRQPT